MRPPGATRPCAEFASCGAESCAKDAEVEVLHAPSGEDSRVWVPLCWQHYTQAPTHGLEYVIEVHGFIPSLPKETP